MIISVTQEHINKGLRKYCKKCPVALALWDVLQTSGVKTVTVSSDYISSYKEGDKNVVDYYMPRSVKRFISSFDANGPLAVKPFKFKLRVTHP